GRGSASCRRRWRSWSNRPSPRGRRMSADSEFCAAAAEIARQAGAILLEHRGRVGIEYKGEADLVTAADRASEAFLTAALRQRFPGHGMVAEEGSRTAGTEYCWYVDPLDGTTNYAHGLPIFAVSLGLGQRELAQSLLATGFPSKKRHANPNIHFYQHFSLRTHGMRRLGSAALDLCYTACGRFEGFWEFNLQPWDTAAGTLIVQEAGGTVSDMMGGRHRLDSPEVLASNGWVHAALLAEFADLFQGKAEALPAAAEYAAARRAR